MNYYTYILLILLTNSLQPRDKFSGCDSDLFPTPLTFTINLTFQTACDDLETCAEDLESSKDVCLAAFKTDMKKICEDLTALNLFRKRFCNKIVYYNMIQAYELDDNIFKMATKKFSGFIVEQSNLNCFNPENNADVMCDEEDDDHKFDFYELVGLQLWVIKDTDGECLNNVGEFETCDLTDETQQFKINDVVAANTALIINNLDEVLTSDDSGVFSFDTEDNATDVNIVINEIYEEGEAEEEE